MNLFKNMKVHKKLLFLSILMVIGFFSIGLTYIAVLEAKRVALNKVKKATGFESDLQDVNERINKSVIHQRDFLLNRRHADMERFETHISEAREILSQLELKAPTDRLKELVTPLKAKLADFHASAYQLTETILDIGVDQDSGLHIEMRRAIHELEKALTIAQEEKWQVPSQGQRSSSSEARLRDRVLDEKLMTSIIAMRRHEKNYLQRANHQYVTDLTEEVANFLELLEQTTFSEAQKNTLGTMLFTYKGYFDDIVKTMGQLQQNRIIVDGMLETVLSTLASLVDATKITSTAVLTAQKVQENRLTTVFTILLVSTTVVVVSIVFFLSRSITIPLQRLQTTVQQVSAGDINARARLDSDDEIGTLANAFDQLLDDRIAQFDATERERAARLAEAERENEALNTSVVELLQAVAQLSQKDLTVKIPVAENVTGPVSDALNLLADETAKVLAEVTQISDAVALTSRSVKSQSDAVVALATSEREQVTQTSDELASAAETMNAVAARAQACNIAAENAIQRTQAALETVTLTVVGINATRDTIRETEKRIKRLGERSQEISGAVNLINNIAERTHILALNASMHAASAGEAGRGFAVVADEVQRLAENARQATEQIASLVSNIQTETMDTVTTMNTVITQVVEGSRLAEQAGEQMRETQQTTADLVVSVQQIAEASQAQATVSNELRNRASIIVESTLKTNQQLEEQSIHTSQLLDYASRLVQAVRVFKLPNRSAASGAHLEPAAVLETASEQDDWQVVINA